MVKDKTKPGDGLNEVMSVYREHELPTPLLIWRTEGKTVAARELSETEFERIRFLLGMK